MYLFCPITDLDSNHDTKSTKPFETTDSIENSKSSKAPSPPVSETKGKEKGTEVKFLKCSYKTIKSELCNVSQLIF